MKIKHLTKDEFVRLVADIEKRPLKFTGSKPAVVDFHATWCGPCNALTPVFEQLAGVFGNKVDFYKVDIDEERQISAALDIRSIPTLVFFSADGSQKRLVGMNPKTDIERLIVEMIKDDYLIKN